MVRTVKIYSLPDDKSLDSLITKIFEDDKSKMAQIMCNLFLKPGEGGGGEGGINVGKREKCCLPIFSFFPHCFQKPFLASRSHDRSNTDLAVKDSTLYHTIPIFNDLEKEGLENIVRKRQDLCL